MMEQQYMKKALAHWGLEGAQTEAVCYANTGHLSENTFTVDGRHVLKCSQGLGSMQRQAALQRALGAHGLAAAVVPTLSGSDTAAVEAWECLLMERLPGEPVSGERLLREPQLGGMVGEGLARLHAALRDCDPLLCSRECITDTLRGWAIPKLMEADAARWGWTDGWLPGLAALEEKLPVQIIHRDPNPDNMLAADGRITGFLDFELSRIAPRIFDLAYAATGALSVGFSAVGQEAGEGFVRLAHAIWSGYHRAAPLAEAERQALPDLVIAIQLICVAAFTGTDRFAALAETNRQMLEVILQKEAQLRKPFA
jgi:Ser/Thr protein kinase RdoA (MazF antagonist)